MSDSPPEWSPILNAFGPRGPHWTTTAASGTLRAGDSVTVRDGYGKIMWTGILRDLERPS